MKRWTLARTLAAALAITLVLAVPHAWGDARPREVMSASELRLALHKLRVLGSALYVGAHPDDENTALLAYLSRERLVRAGYLSVTRGDGGQNLIGPETGELLGAIRTQELLAARRIDGAEQHFTRAVDFGYSKSPEETMEIWGRERVLADMVWAIRRFRPDVIITRFPTDGGGGHGHHTASALLAEEAFAAAADPARFPEQLGVLRPWRARRLLWNAWRPQPESRDPKLPPLLTVDLGSYSPLLGRSYTEIAAESRSMHKSQGFGSAERRGSIPNYFEHRQGDTARADLFEGLELGWSRVAGGQRVDRLLLEAESGFRPDQPDLVLPLLLRAHAALATLGRDPWVEVKRAELLEVVRSCAGLWIEAVAAAPAASPGEDVRVTVAILNRSRASLSLERVEVLPSAAGSAAADAPAGRADRELAFNRPVADTFAVRLPENLDFTQPYWLRERPARGHFVVEDPADLDRAENPPPLTARFTVRAGSERLSFETPVVYRSTDPVAGERYRPFEVVPPVTVRLEQGVYVFPDLRPKPVRVLVRSTRGKASPRVRLVLPAGWRAQPPDSLVAFEGREIEAGVSFLVHPAAGPPAGAVAAVAEMEGRTYSHALVRIDYPHLPIQTLFPPAEARLVRADIRLSGENVGYVMGSGDQVAEALRQVGYRVTLLSDEDLESADLAGFHAVIVGVRAYNTRPRLRAQQARLLDYVRDGGTLVVQYNTADASLDDRLGPYPFKISRDRITVEEAPVRLLAPDHPLLHHPNEISAADFEGWMQERGLYFANPWDARYETVLSANDPGEKPLDGGLLFARVGKGAFIYTGYSWFRQLPAGVPGAFRLFVNLVSGGR